MIKILIIDLTKFLITPIPYRPICTVKKVKLKKKSVIYNCTFIRQTKHIVLINNSLYQSLFLSYLIYSKEMYGLMVCAQSYRVGL